MAKMTGLGKGLDALFGPAPEEEQVKENVQRIEQVIAPPTRTKVKEQEEILEIAFKVRGNKEKLKALVNYLKDGGYEYEQC